MTSFYEFVKYFQHFCQYEGNSVFFSWHDSNVSMVKFIRWTRRNRPKENYTFPSNQRLNDYYGKCWKIALVHTVRITLHTIASSLVEKYLILNTSSSERVRYTEKPLYSHNWKIGRFLCACNLCDVAVREYSVQRETAVNEWHGSDCTLYNFPGKCDARENYLAKIGSTLVWLISFKT